MSGPPASSTNYRNPKVEDDDDDDLDDLDDVLASFNAPPKPSLGKRPFPTDAPKAPTPSKIIPSKSTQTDTANKQESDVGDDFEASLVEGMESLLRQLAGDHPPGPMADLPSGDKPSLDPENKLTKEEEEEAWQRAVDMMLSGEGLKALGLDKDQPTPQPPRGEEKPDFDETIRRTMEQLKNPKSTGNDMGSNDLASLLASLGGEGGLEGLGGDDDLGGLLDGMMAQLMTKEVLEEPMSELASKYPDYLANPPEGVSPSDLEKYRKQHQLVSQIVSTFKKADYTDEKDGKEVARLVGEMQDLGGPPSEIMGDLPEGFDLNALGGNEDGCTIM